jgi:hypothetical protein
MKLSDSEKGWYGLVMVVSPWVNLCAVFGLWLAVPWNWMLLTWLSINVLSVFGWTATLLDKRIDKPGPEA